MLYFLAPKYRKKTTKFAEVRKLFPRARLNENMNINFKKLFAIHMSFSPLKGRWSENRWKTKRDNLPYANFCLVKFHEELQPSHRLNCKNSNSRSHDPNLFAEHKMCTLEKTLRTLRVNQETTRLKKILRVRKILTKHLPQRKFSMHTRN